MERGEEGEITCLNIRDADVHGARVCAVEQERTNERASERGRSHETVEVGAVSV